MSGAADFRYGLIGVREVRSISLDDAELKATANGTLAFRGYASVTEVPYEMEDMFGTYTEVVRSGAFKRTLTEGADVGLVINHEGIPLARTKPGTLSLIEDGKGLLADAPALDPASPLVQTVRSAMDRGDLDEMSMAFRVNLQEWSPDYMQRDILQVNLHKGDVSLVNYGASPHTSAALVARQLRMAAPERPAPAVTVPLDDGWLEDVKAELRSNGVVPRPPEPSPERVMAEVRSTLEQYGVRPTPATKPLRERIYLLRRAAKGD